MKGQKDLAEGRFLKWLGPTLEKSGAKLLKIHGHLMQAAGWPDLLVSARTWHGLIELKAKDHPLDPLQRICIRELEERLYPVCVLRERKSGEALIIEDSQGEELGHVPPSYFTDGKAILAHIRDTLSLYGR